MKHKTVKGKRNIRHEKQNPLNKTKTSNKHSIIAIPSLVLILAITLFAYLPTFENDFTNWDDNKYVLENPTIESLSAENISTIFSSYYMGNYHPLTMLTFVIDHKLSGDKRQVEPFVFQLTNVVLHLVNTLLLFFFVYFLFALLPAIQKNGALWIALFATFIFGVHTMHVESVSWISERKDVLYAAFFILSLIFYVKYIATEKKGFLFASLMAFLLSLFSKGQAVSLAVSLLAIDFLLQRNLVSKRVIIEKIPYFVLSLVFGIVAINAQGDVGAINYTEAHGMGHKILFSIYAYVQYWLKLIYPSNLSALYTYPLMNNGMPIKYWLTLIPFAGIIGLLIYSIKKNRIVAFGLLLFSINIFLLLQLLQVGGAIMSDRYSYIPSIGYVVIVGLLLYYLLQKGKLLRTVSVVVLSAYCILLATMTHARTQVWKDSLTLWDDVISKYDNSAEAWVNRGNYKYKELKDYKGALYDFDQALQLKGDLAEALTGRGVAKRNLGDLKGAMADYDKSLKFKPGNIETYSNRGVCKAMMNLPEEAIKDFNKALEINPSHAMSLTNRGGAKFKLKQYKEAIKDFDAALQLDPYYADAYSNRASAKFQLNDSKGALADYDKALALVPGKISTYINKGLVLQQIGSYQASIEVFSKVLAVSPVASVYYSRGISYLKLDQKDLACQDFQKSAAAGFANANLQLQEYCK